MSDQETYVAELLLEDAMDEVFHGGPSPELADRILRAANGVEEADAEVAPAQESQSTPAVQAEPVPAAPMKLLPGGLRQRPWYRWAIDGAVAACVAAVLVLVFVPNNEVEPNPPQVSVELPAGVAATDDAQYIPGALGGAEDALQVEGGWYVLTNGAPVLTNGGHRVENVEGKVLVKVGEIPNEEELAAQMPWLTTHEIEEKDMSAKQWIKVGALAVCVLAGSAFVNDSYVMAQDTDRRESDVRPAVKLEQLEDELEALEAKKARANGMDDGEAKRKKLARIENAIKDKKVEIANLKERIRNAKDGKRRDSDRKDSDRKDSDRKDSDRKDSDRKDSDRRDSDRKDADRRAKEDAERKRKEEERARKERESDRKKRDSDRRKDDRKS